MEERQAGEASRVAEEPEHEGGERIRVTDRRRINFDETAGGTAPPTPNLKPSYVEELEARTQAAEQKTADVQARFEQVRAELRRETDETRQRLNRAAEERVARDKAAFISSLLPVMDNFQRAMEAAEKSDSMGALLDGLRGTLNGFANALATAGAEPIESLGMQFDPELHEAVDTVEVEAGRDGLITAEHTRGYRMGGKLLRPARVQVGRARGEAQGAAE